MSYSSQWPKSWLAVCSFFAFTYENENECRQYRRNQPDNRNGPDVHVARWPVNCPVCWQLMEKKFPTETVPCTCGKYVWKG